MTTQAFDGCDYIVGYISQKVWDYRYGTVKEKGAALYADE